MNKKNSTNAYNLAALAMQELGTEKYFIGEKGVCYYEGKVSLRKLSNFVNKKDGLSEKQKQETAIYLDVLFKSLLRIDVKDINKKKMAIRCITFLLIEHSLRDEILKFQEKNKKNQEIFHTINEVLNRVDPGKVFTSKLTNRELSKKLQYIATKYQITKDEKEVIYYFSDYFNNFTYFQEQMTINQAVNILEDLKDTLQEEIENFDYYDSTREDGDNLLYISAIDRIINFILDKK